MMSEPKVQKVQQSEITEDSFTVSCLACNEARTYVASGGRLTLYSHGWMVLEFWCQACYEHNAWRIVDVDFAEQISRLGVPTRLVSVPAEMLEHPSMGESINEVDVRQMENVNLTYFQERLNRESVSWRF